MTGELKRVQCCGEAGCDEWFDKLFKTLYHNWDQSNRTVVIQTGYSRFFCHWDYGGGFEAFGDDGLAEGDVEDVYQDIC